MTNHRPIITAYCYHWHINTSNAFVELVTKPLAPYINIQMVGWDKQEMLPIPRADETVIFCQHPPTEAWLSAHEATVIWIPMLDYGKRYPPNMVNHPRVRVVAFSDEVASWAIDLGLPHLRLHYFLNPALFPQASFDGERVLLYWNRTGLFRADFLKRLCQTLSVDKLIFRSKIDPPIPKEAYYDLPDQFGKTKVVQHHELTSPEAYFDLLRQANIFIAPRQLEGLGFTVLEAMASGCAVFGFNAQTMNTYIQHGVNGYLINPVAPNKWIKLAHRAYRGIHRRWYVRRHHTLPNYPFITQFQNWQEIRRLNLAQLGMNARASQANGYEQWQASIPTYAKFILGDTP